MILTLVLLGIFGGIDARKRKCTTTPSCNTAVASQATTATAATAVTVATLKNKGETCTLSKQCNSNLACDVRKQPPQFICLPVLNGACLTSLDCVNNLNCYSGKCGCPVRNSSI